MTTLIACVFSVLLPVYVQETYETEESTSDLMTILRRSGLKGLGEIDVKRTTKYELHRYKIREKGQEMTIEESVRNSPAKFQAILDNTTPAVKEAMNELSAKLDIIFNGAIREYCDAEGCEAKIDDIPTYKTLNKMITGKIDEVTREHIKGKRKDIE